MILHFDFREFSHIFPRKRKRRGTGMKERREKLEKRKKKGQKQGGIKTKTKP